MPVSVEELMTAMTPEQALELLFAIMRGHGFTVVDSWQSGSLERTQFEAFANLSSELTSVAQTLAKAGFNQTAIEGWLELLSDSHYDNQRLEGVKTRGNIELNDDGGTGPHTVDVGDIVITDEENGYRYRNIEAGTIPLDGTETLEFEAELAGHGQNLAAGAITVLVEGPPGITVENAGSDWITVEGSDPESDASLRQRNRTKWATLSPHGTAAAYENHARTASGAVTRVFVDDQNPRGPGTLDVYLAGDDGPVSEGAAPLVTGTVSDYITGITDGIDRRGVGADLQVLSAVERSITLTATVYYLPTSNPADVETAVEAALETFFEELPIGGAKTTDPEQGQLLMGALYQLLFSVTGVVNVVFTAPTEDVDIEAGEVVVPTLALTYTAAVF